MFSYNLVKKSCLFVVDMILFVISLAVYLGHMWSEFDKFSDFCFFCSPNLDRIGYDAREICKIAAW